MIRIVRGSLNLTNGAGPRWVDNEADIYNAWFSGRLETNIQNLFELEQNQCRLLLIYV